MTRHKAIFIHGAGGSAKTWFFQAAGLEDILEVIPVDLPGHGSAGDDGICTSIEGYRDYVLKAIPSTAGERCFLAGHSMGGAIAMSFALAYPELVEGLILICTGARLRVFPKILEGILKDKEETLQLIVDHAFSKKAPAEMKEISLAEMMKCDTKVIHRDFTACDRFDIMGDLSSISQPTLVICGREDVLTPPGYSEYLSGKIVPSQLVLIEGAGHMVMLEEPEAVNQAIRDFVTGMIDERDGKE